LPSNTAKIAEWALPALFVVLWSSGFIGAKYGLPYAEPLTFLAVRMAAAVLLLALFALVTRAPWPNARAAAHSVVAGLLVHGLYLSGVFISISLAMPAGLAALITGLQPVLTSTLANRLLGERVSARQWLGLLLGFVGVYLVVQERSMSGETPAAAWIAVFVALIGISVGTLYQKRFAGGLDLRTNVLIQYMAAGIFFAVGAFLFETRDVQWTADFLFALSWLIFVLSFGAVLLLFVLIRRSAATQVASFFYLTPPVTALIAWAMFDERLHALALAGMAVCVVAVLLVNWRAKA
jgi:drug/metabolite transporter (DMT)-like permease